MAAYTFLIAAFLGTLLCLGLGLELSYWYSCVFVIVGICLSRSSADKVILLEVSLGF